jgi:hypothetical protein
MHTIDYQHKVNKPYVKISTTMVEIKQNVKCFTNHKKVFKHKPKPKGKKK